VTPADHPLPLFDFREPLAVRAWTAIDDRVMGGGSVSTLRHDAAGHAVFEGEVSLDQSGLNAERWGDGAMVSFSGC